MAVVTKTLKSSGGDYSLMSTWESTEQTDLVSDGDSHVLECYVGTTTTGGWQANGDLNDTTTIVGWTAGASNTIKIKPAAGEGHEGVVGAGFLMYRAAGTGAPILLQQAYTTIEGFTLKNTTTGSGGALLIGGTVTAFLVDSMILDANGGSQYSLNIGSGATLTDGEIRNSIIYNSSQNGTMRNFASGGFDINNCMFRGTGGNIVLAANCDLTNCVSMGPSACYNASHYNSLTTCASQDLTGNITGVSISDGVDFVEPSTDNYNVEAGGKLDGAGTDLSGTFTDDITGYTRG